MEEQGMIESRYACYIVNRSPISVDDKIDASVRFTIVSVRM